ncbi:Lipocalin-like domain protein [Planctomycetes bacterium Poly30]|uniref:Lipocalin-like domain protein n=1 Tax=Saltatorellus ferox TaxID=2528018 RepID=A0A518ELH2_9BACT|nr:Lipocalin-like domain protein [Planctomycetes bacterium Poly30]
MAQTPEDRWTDSSSKILTSYVFREGSLEGELETIKPTGFVEDETGAVRGMRFLWPLKAESLVAYLNEAYSETITLRRKRDYAWIMTRDPQITDERYAALVARLAAMGCDAAEVRRVPQDWPDAGHPVSKAEGDMAHWTRAND